MVSEEITAYLEAQGIGTRGMNLFSDVTPEQPDNLVSVNLYTGSPHIHTLGGGAGSAALERPRLQVSARNTDHDNGWDKANDALLLLDGLNNTTLSGVSYLSIFALQPVFLIDRDQNNRWVFGFNIEVVKELS